MTQALTIRSAILVAVFGFAAVLNGCSDPRFKQKQEVRDARVSRYLNDYAAHDAAGADRMRRTLDLHESLVERRAEHLTRTCDQVRSHHERDVRRWKAEEALRRERIETILRGKPEQIDDTYAKMVY